MRSYGLLLGQNSREKKRVNTDKNKMKVVKLHNSNPGRRRYKTPKNKTPAHFKTPDVKTPKEPKHLSFQNS